MFLYIIGFVAVGIVIYLVVLSRSPSIQKAIREKQTTEQPKQPAKRKKTEPECQAAPAGGTTWPSKGEFLFDVVGESNYQEAIKQIAGDHGDREPKETYIATIIPDASNQYDDKAVRIEIQGQVVGYMSRDDARSFRRRLGTKKLTDKETTSAAKITGGWVGKDGKRVPYGIKLDIKPFW